MALVAYEYSSGSENEEEAEKPDSLNKHEKNGIGASEISDEEDDLAPPTASTSSSMFDKLPQKKEIVQEVYEDKVEDFIPKAEIPPKRAKVKITIPSLTDFEDLEDEEPSEKKIKPSAKGSGLLSLLPPVKCIPISNKSFLPNVLMQKPKTTITEVKKVSKPLIPQSVIKNKRTKKVKSTESDDSDEDMELPETFDEDLWKKSCGKPVKKDIIEEKPIIELPQINIAPEAVKPYEGLDNTAFKELVGNSKRMPRNIKLIDVNEEQLVAETDLWMTKSLTDPNYIPKKTEEDDDSIDPTKRKKHHITYLAQQAKANEQELQNQWSASKFTRNQTRAKYGF